MKVKTIEINMEDINNPEELKAALMESIGNDVAEHFVDDLIENKLQRIVIAHEANETWESDKEGVIEATKRNNGGKLPQGEELLGIGFRLGYCACADREYREAIREGEEEA